MNGIDWSKLATKATTSDIAICSCGWEGHTDELVVSYEDVDYFDEDTETHVQCTGGHGHYPECNKMLI